MNLPIIIRTFVQQLRDKGTYIYFLLFPLTLMLVLGSILQGVFAGSAVEEKVEPITVQYVVEDQALGGQFKMAVRELSSTKIKFNQSADRASAVRALRAGKADAYFNIGDKIVVRTNQLSDVQLTLLKSYLVEMFQSIRLMAGAQRFNVPPAELFTLPAELNDALKVDQTNLKKQATSYQYYAVAMIALFILYMAENGLEMFSKGRRRKTLQRELISPLGRQKLINSTFAGHALLGFCVVLVQMLITQVLFKVPWQQQFGFAFISLSALMLLFLTLGVFLETIGKGVGMGIMQIIIQVAAFLGGGYFPVSETMMNFSPLGWIMGPLREALWTNNPLQWRGVFLCLLITVILYCGMSLVLNRREEF